MTSRHQSSFEVQPEVVFADNRPRQRRITGFDRPLHNGATVRIGHEQYPISVSQLSATAIRVCSGEPGFSSQAVLNPYGEKAASDRLNLIEWSWLPDAHWHIGRHRQQAGLSTSRGLYADEQGGLHLYLRFPNEWPVYGLGEKTGELNKQGRRWTFWNSDVFEPHTEANDCLYVSVPLLLTVTEQGWMGILLDNPGRTTVDLSLEHEVCFSTEHGAVDLYIFVGQHVADILDQYTQLTGRPALPPNWALGYHQSRHSYTSVTEVIELVDAFREHDLPLDAIYLDILYMDAYRVFSFDPQAFAQAPELIRNLLHEGIRVVPIIDPGVKLDPDYAIYQQAHKAGYFVKREDGSEWVGKVWPGDSVWPDFFQPEVQRWWQQLHRFFTEMGVQGFWNDMNEPAVFNDRMTMDDEACHQLEGQWHKHASLHNAYALKMSEATAQALAEQTSVRPFVLTRAGYAGIQRAAAVWTGDNRSSWEHLRLSVPMLINMGLSGLPFVGADIGGFMDSARPELFVRWMQLGCFYPLMRNHCAIGQASQEPWCFGPEALNYVRQSMHRRYRLFPYLQQLLIEANDTGAPVMRPMFWSGQPEPETQNLADQFMFGDELLVAPILSAGTFSRSVWLPGGDWYSLLDRQLCAGEQHQLAQCGLGDIPLYARAGAILPLSPYRPNTTVLMCTLRLLIVAGRDRGRLLYRDMSDQADDTRYGRLSFGYRMQGDDVDCHLSLSASNTLLSFTQLEVGIPESWRHKRLTLNGQRFSTEQPLSVEGLNCRIVTVEPADWL